MYTVYLLSLDAKKLTFSQNNYYFWWPTLWTLKYFLRDMHAIPICLNKFITLLGDPPDIRIPKLSRKFPTGIFDPGIFGWLHHTFSLLLHLLFPQMVLTSTKDPICLVSTSGLSDLQDGQQWNSNNNWVRKTMYLGSVRRFWSLLDVLFWKKNLRYYYVVYVCYFTMVMTYMLYHKFRNDKNNFRSLLLPRGSGRQIFIIWLFCTCFTYKFRFFDVRLLVWIRCQVIIIFLMQTPSRSGIQFFCSRIRPAFMF